MSTGTMNTSAMGVMISPGRWSVSSKMLWMSSLSPGSSVPLSPLTSTSARNSRSVNAAFFPAPSPPPSRRRIPLAMISMRKRTGATMREKRRSGRAEKAEKDLALGHTMHLGVMSPRIRIVRVPAARATISPYAGIIGIRRAASTEERETLTSSLPMNIVAISRLGVSSIFPITSAIRFPSFFHRMRSTRRSAKNAVSEAEKKAEAMIRRRIRRNFIRSSLPGAPNSPRGPRTPGGREDPPGTDLYPSLLLPRSPGRFPASPRRRGHPPFRPAAKRILLQRLGDDLVHVVHQGEREPPRFAARDVLQILPVLSGHDDLGDPGPQGREGLFLQPSDREHPSPEGDLPRHRHVAPDGDPREGRDERGGDGDPGGRPVLRDRPRGDVDVDVMPGMEVLRKAEAGGARPRVRDGRLGALLHHVPERPGDGDGPLPLHEGHLDKEDVPPGGGPGQARRHADLVPLPFRIGEVLRDAEELREVAVGHRERSEEHTSELQSRLHLAFPLFNDAAPPEIYPLSLHAALPISTSSRSPSVSGRYFGTPRNFERLRWVTGNGPFSPSAILRATFRQMVEISRSRLRSPASLVYWWMIPRIPLSV